MSGLFEELAAFHLDEFGAWFEGDVQRVAAVRDDVGLVGEESSAAPGSRMPATRRHRCSVLMGNVGAATSR